VNNVLRKQRLLPNRSSATHKPRILFVAMANSQHAAGWIAQLEGGDWESFLFPVESPKTAPIHPDVRRRAPSVELVEGWPIPVGGQELVRKTASPFKPGWMPRAWQLARVIRKLKPDVVHSLEIQHAGYLTNVARLMLRDRFPTWVVSNWGSDTYIFGRIDAHRDRLREVLSACDYYTSECSRDIAGAQQLGLRGEVLPVLPAAGGVDTQFVRQFRTQGPSSARRVIALRGYQGWAGRALVGLRAIVRAADVLGEYEVDVYNWESSPDMAIALELAAKESGVCFNLIRYGPKEQIWRLHGRSRALIALSIGDGISTSMLEAITMGSFPIQSDTSCAGEWIEHGKTGFLVHPEDPQEVETALRRVVADDELVDRAAETNAAVVSRRLDQSAVRPQAVALYRRVLEETGAVTRNG
jgi:hypothetical protein